MIPAAVAKGMSSPPQTSLLCRLLTGIVKTIITADGNDAPMSSCVSHHTDYVLLCVYSFLYACGIHIPVSHDYAEFSCHKRPARSETSLMVIFPVARLKQMETDMNWDMAQDDRKQFVGKAKS